MATKVTVPSVARMLRDIVTPEGFEREVRVEPKSRWFKAYKVLVLKSPTITIEVHFNCGGRDSYELATGHVTFKTPDGERTFDRYGVEDSFYVNNPLKWDKVVDPIAETNDTIRNFVEVRIPEQLERIARSESVPGIPFSVTPERKELVTATLKRGERYSFMPSGFGTGYALLPRRTQWGKSDPKLAKFFGVPTVYVEKFDAD